MTTKIRDYEVARNDGSDPSNRALEWLQALGRNQDEFFTFRDLIDEARRKGLDLLIDEQFQEFLAMASARTDRSKLEGRILIGNEDLAALVTILTLAHEVTDHIYGKGYSKR